MADERSFLQSILSQPSRSNWISFADWLDERSDPRAEIIRVQQKLSSATEDKRLRLERRMQEMILGGILPAIPTIANSIEMQFALIPAGVFQMGAPESDSDAFARERPCHSVRITRPFLMGIHLVTQGQLMQNKRWLETAFGGNRSDCRGDPQLPAERVNWFRAIMYCNCLSEQEELDPFYEVRGDGPYKMEAADVSRLGGNGYRLPTEAEWEYACRAGTTSRWNLTDDPNVVTELGWFAANSEGTTHPVGLKRPNAWGLYDLHGNVREWCWDAELIYEDFYSKSPQDDPIADGEDDMRIHRGGSWEDSAIELRCSNCGAEVAEDDGGIGFRIVRNYEVP